MGDADERDIAIYVYIAASSTIDTRTPSSKRVTTNVSFASTD
jgi:hypothetical protein